MKAGAAVLAHIGAACRGVALALAPAALDGPWLSAGPLQTGLRTFGSGGIFTVGNAAAEAHPIVAEGISMAIQSAALLCGRLSAHPELRGDTPIAHHVFERIRDDYARDWRANAACTSRRCSRICSCGPASARIATESSNASRSC
jgi:hypothetical protein